jgi:hypothetical protein
MTMYSTLFSRKLNWELAPCSGTPLFLMSITIHQILGIVEWLHFEPIMDTQYPPRSFHIRSGG